MAPVAILTTQPPQALGLTGYPYENIMCTITVKKDDGTSKQVMVKRQALLDSAGFRRQCVLACTRG